MRYKLSSGSYYAKYISERQELPMPSHLFELLDNRNQDYRGFNTTVAMAIGDRNAIVLDRVRYQQTSGHSHYHYDMWWVGKTLKRWHQEDFSFWSFSTVRNAFQELVHGFRLLHSTAEFNDDPLNRTLWYALNGYAIQSFFAMWENAGKPPYTAKEKTVKIQRNAFWYRWSQVTLLDHKLLSLERESTQC
jgi:hypothetical protein